MTVANPFALIKLMPRIAIFVAIAVVIGLILGFLIFSNNKTSTISGSLDLNGQPPAGSTITFMQRAVGQGNFTPFMTSQSPADMMKWQFTKALPNTNYEIRAVITQGSDTLDTSEVLTVTAPASGSIVHFNFNNNDPSKTTSSSPAPSASPTATPTPQQTNVTGTIDLNGYIPSGATITLQERPVGTQLYQTIGTPFAASDNASWVWKEALVNNEYNIRAVMSDSSGNVIGTSQPLTVSAPAANEVITLNSSAVQPAPQANTTISGSLMINGVIPGGSSVVVLQTNPGNTQYQTVVSGLNAATGTTWSWNGATSGTQYQITAALKASNGNVIAVSPAVTVTAPASNEVLTLNSNYSIPGPTNLPSITCGTKNSATNSWSATINYNTIPGAQTYWLQLGTTSGGYNMVNVTTGPNNSTYVTVNATLNDSVTYYAQYAYSMSPGVSMGSNFSAFSPSQPLMCP